mgnify:CR=1 FL=1
MLLAMSLDKNTESYYLTCLTYLNNTEQSENMSCDNSRVVTNWKQEIISKVYHNTDHSQSDKNEEHFSKYFGNSNIDCFTFSEKLTVDQCGNVSGEGTVTKNKSWIWPTFHSFLLAWDGPGAGLVGVSGGRGSSLHSVTGRWEAGALAGGVALFRYCNDVTLTVNIRCQRNDAAEAVNY